jgi:hypothetical protein
MEVTRRLGQEILSVKTSPMQQIYTANMRGVDVQDQMRVAYSTYISTKKWWLRLFWWGFDTSTTNAYILYYQTYFRLGMKPKSHVEV